MRIILVIALFLNLSAQAANKYYVSNSGSDNSSGTTPSTAWQTIGKVNASMSLFNGGDSILFNRGQVFVGALLITRSGATGNPIVIAAYGTGNKPILTTFTTLSGWTNSGNIYTSTALTTSPQSPANLLVLNGQVQTMGRWPNPPSNQNQWTLKHEAITSSTITDNDWGTLTKPSGVTDWIGAEIVYRFNRWQVRHGKITAQDSGSHAVYHFTTKTFDGTVQVGTGESGYSYFIQNDARTLDQNGEWYYNPTTKRTSIYLSSGTTGTVIQIPMYDKAVSGNSGVSNITIQNLAINGANQYGVYFSGGSAINVLDCDVHNAPEGVRIASTSSKAVVKRNNVYDCTSMGIAKKGGSGTLDSNHVHHIMWLMGMNENNNGNGQGVYSESSGSMSYNQVDSVAYNGIHPQAADNIVVERNVVNYATMWVDDGGGIYTVAVGRNNPNEYFKSRIIRNNIVNNSRGNAFGTGDGIAWGGYGFYGDNNARNYTLIGNYFHNNLHGIYLHFPQNVAVLNNLVVNDNGANAKSFIIDNSVSGYVTDSITFTGNILSSSNKSAATSNQGLMVLLNNSSGGSIGSWGTFDNNYFVKPLDSTATLIYATGNGAMKLKTWQPKFGFDTHSVLSPVFYPNAAVNSVDPAVIFKYISNETNSNQLYTLGGIRYIDAKSVVDSNNTIAVNAFTATQLLSLGTAANSTNINPVVSVTSPANNSVFTQPLNLNINASASDADGTVSKVDFYSGSSLLGTDNSLPYSISWNSVPSGTFSLTAKATDNKGGVTISSPISITVNAPNVPPSVSVTSPVNNGKFIAPASISLAVNAIDNDGFISSVSYYNGTTLIATLSASPFTYTWSGVTSGSYAITAVATDNNGASTTSAPINISVRQLVAPNVSVTSPTNGSTYLSPASITITATATDPDGVIQRVEFYQNNVLVNKDATSPYSFTLSGLSAGTYTLTAKAIDNDSLATSASVQVVVTAPKTPPSVSITAPANGLTIADPAQITLSANASDADGTISHVDFYENNVFVGSDYTSPYSISWTSIMVGNYNIYAIAVDNDSLKTTSSSVNITVTHQNVPPTIDIIEPLNGDSTTTSNIVRLTAVATDNDGLITKVEFYNGSTLIGTATSTPYSITTTLPTGNYTLTAKATDNNGATASKSIAFKVTEAVPIIIPGIKAVIVPIILP